MELYALLDGRLPKGKYKFKKSLGLEPGTVSVGLVPSRESDGVSKPEFDDMASYAAYVVLSGVNNAYASRNGKLFLFKRKKIGDEKSPFIVEIHEYPDDEIERQGLLDDFFEGVSATHISLSPKEIIEEYRKSNAKTIGMLILLVALGVAYYAFLSYVDTSNIKISQQQAPRPVYDPLTPKEMARLKRWAALEALKAVEEEAKKTVGILKTKRIASVNIGEAEEVPQSEPVYDEEGNRWYFPSAEEENLRRGGIRLLESQEIQRSFLSSGVEISDPDLQIYSKSKSVTKTGGIKELMATKSVPLTRSCVETVLYGISPKVIPEKRKDGSIEIRLDKVRPTAVLNNLKWVALNCPFSIRNVELSQGRFSLVAVLAEEPGDI